MPSTVIEVNYINPPAQGKKMGSVKDTSGQYYGVSPAMLGLFQQGGVYDVFYEERDFQGKTYRTIKNVTAVPRHNVAPAPAPVHASQTMIGQVAAQAPRSSGFALAAAQERSQEIWVNSMMQRAIDGGKLDPWNEEACVEYGEIQKRVHRRLFVDPAVEPQPQPQPVGAQATPQQEAQYIPVVSAPIGAKAAQEQRERQAFPPSNSGGPVYTPANPQKAQKWDEEMGDVVPF